jgi:hypothetical protein
MPSLHAPVGSIAVVALEPDRRVGEVAQPTFVAIFLAQVPSTRTRFLRTEFHAGLLELKLQALTRYPWNGGSSLRAHEMSISNWPLIGESEEHSGSARVDEKLTDSRRGRPLSRREATTQKRLSCGFPGAGGLPAILQRTFHP